MQRSLESIAHQLFLIDTVQRLLHFLFVEKWDARLQSLLLAHRRLQHLALFIFGERVKQGVIVLVVCLVLNVNVQGIRLALNLMVVALAEALEPRMLERVTGGDPVVRALLQHGRAEALALRAQTVPELCRERDLAYFVSAKDLGILFGVEHELGREKNVHDNSQAKDVGLASIADAVEDLWSDVARRAAACSQRYSSARRRQSEVNDDQ